MGTHIAQRQQESPLETAGNPTHPPKEASNPRSSNNLDPFHENRTPCRAFGQPKAELGCMEAMQQPPGSFPSHLQGAVAAVQVVQTWREDELIEGTTQRLQRAKRSKAQACVPATGALIPVPLYLPLRISFLLFRSGVDRGHVPGNTCVVPACRLCTDRGRLLPLLTAGCVSARHSSSSTICSGFTPSWGQISESRTGLCRSACEESRAVGRAGSGWQEKLPVSLSKAVPDPAYVGRVLSLSVQASTSLRTALCPCASTPPCPAPSGRCTLSTLAAGKGEKREMAEQMCCVHSCEAEWKVTSFSTRRRGSRWQVPEDSKAKVTRSLQMALLILGTQLTWAAALQGVDSISTSFSNSSCTAVARMGTLWGSATLAPRALLT